MKKKYLRQAAELSLRSGCLRAKRGAVFVRQGKVLVAGFNFPFPENTFCQKHGCLRDKLGLGLGQELEKCRAIHAEAAAVAQAAKKGISLAGATAYLTCAPCINCAKLLLVVGVRRVYYLDYYGDQTGVTFLEKMGVKCRRVKLAGDTPQKRLRDVSGQKD